MRQLNAFLVIVQTGSLGRDGEALQVMQREIDLALGMACAGTDEIDEIRDCRWLKSLVAQSGFLSWMADSIYDAERRARSVPVLRGQRARLTDSEWPALLAPC